MGRVNLGYGIASRHKKPQATDLLDVSRLVLELDVSVELMGEVLLLVGVLTECVAHGGVGMVV